MSRRIAARSLPIHAAPHLAESLRAAASSTRRHPDTFADRAVISFGCGLRDLPTTLVDHDEFRLFALTWRRQGNIVTAPLARYRAVVDLPGTGRVSFAHEITFDMSTPPGGRGNPRRRLVPGRDDREAVLGVRMHEAAEDADRGEIRDRQPAFPAFYYAFEPDALPVFESTYAAADWAAAEVVVGHLRCWPLRMFARAPGATWASHPATGGPPPDAEGLALGDRTPCGWMMADEGLVPLAQTPAGVLVDLRPVRGLSARNPAYRAMRACGVIPDNEGYAAFRGHHSRIVDGVREPAKVDAESPVGRKLSDLSPEAARILFRTYKDASIAADWKPQNPADMDEQDLVAELLQEPVRPAIHPGAGAVHVVRLQGVPSPDTAVFRDPAVTLDLYDLGRDAADYAPLVPRRNLSAPWLQPIR